MSDPADNPLLRISSQSNLLEIWRHIENGVDINARDGDGNTPLILAVLAQRANIASLLLSKGAHPLAKNTDGKTALDLAMPIYIAVQQEVVGNALDGVNTDAGTKNSLRWSRLLSALEKADQAARTCIPDFKKPTQAPVRTLRRLRYKK